LGEETDDIKEQSFGDPWSEDEVVHVQRSLDYSFPTE
jgi:hypothetical protein